MGTAKELGTGAHPSGIGFTSGPLTSSSEILKGVDPATWRKGMDVYLRRKQEEVKNTITADYKIQVNFSKGRTVMGPNAIVFSFWLSGKRLHGGGDEMMYICCEADEGTYKEAFTVGKNTSRNGCGAFIPPSAIKGGIAVCPGCQRGIRADKLTAQIYARLGSRELANKLAVYCRDLRFAADVVLKYANDDVRVQTLEQSMGSPQIAATRGAPLVYPLNRLLKDTAAGGQLEDRLFAMVTS